jgi:hypothetical protein
MINAAREGVGVKVKVILESAISEMGHQRNDRIGGVR